MKSSCVRHPESELLIIIRKWQMEFCDGDRVSAALLSFFEYWHNIKLSMVFKNSQANNTAEKHGYTRDQDESLWQFHTENDLEEGIMIFGATSIGKGIEKLEKKGAITVSRNPNPRYKFDRTRFFLFNPEVINEWLDNRVVSGCSNGIVNSDLSSVKSDAPSINSDGRSGESDDAITEIPSKNNSGESAAPQLRSDSGKSSNIDPMKAKIYHLVGWDAKTISKRDAAEINEAHKVLKEAGYTLEDLERFDAEVWAKDWRWIKNKERPTLQQLRQEIGKLRAGQMAFSKKTTFQATKLPDYMEELSK